MLHNLFYQNFLSLKNMCLQIKKYAGLSNSILITIMTRNNHRQQRSLVYAPYWFSITRCPPLRFRLVDLVEEKNPRTIALLFRSKRRDEEILGEITEEEIHEGHTIASALNFNFLGLSASITRSDQEQHFGPVKDLSPLGDMVINLVLSIKLLISNVLFMI